MEKQRTPLAELLDYLNEFENKPIKPTIQNIKEKIWQLLNKEKEAFEKAIDETNKKWRSPNSELILSGKQYYNETFKQ